MSKNVHSCGSSEEAIQKLLKTSQKDNNYCPVAKVIGTNNFWNIIKVSIT